MTATVKRTPDQQRRRNRLIDLAVWAAGEKAKQDLGLPSEWDQGLWVGHGGCGTTCCLAGKVALDDGGLPVLNVDGEDVTDPAEIRRLWGTEDWSDVDIGRVVFPDLRILYVDDYAQQVLGLDSQTAYRLFSSSNGLPEVIEVIGDVLQLIDEEENRDE